MRAVCILMIDKQKAMERLQNAYDEMRHIYISGDTDFDKYVEHHAGAQPMLSAVTEFVEGDICLGELLNQAISLQARYGEPQGNLSPVDNNYIPEIPNFKTQMQYLVNAALFDKGKDNYSDMCSIDLRNECYSHAIYKMTAEELVEFGTRDLTYADLRGQEFREPWADADKKAASEKYPLVLEEYLGFVEKAAEIKRIHQKIKDDVETDKKKYKDFDIKGYIARQFPMDPTFGDDGYFRGSWYQNRYFDITAVYTKNPIYADVLGRNYTQAEMSMRRNFFDDPYATFAYEVQRHMFGMDSEECKPDFDYMDKLMRTHIEDTTAALFGSEGEKAEYMQIAQKCWAGLKRAKIEYGNFATTLTSTKDLKMGLFMFAALSDRHSGGTITDKAGNRTFADGSYQKKTGDYGLVELDMFGEEGASMRISDLTEQRMAKCLQEIYFDEVRSLRIDVKALLPSIRERIGNKPPSIMDGKNVKPIKRPIK